MSAFQYGPPQPQRRAQTYDAYASSYGESGPDYAYESSGGAAGAARARSMRDRSELPFSRVLDRAGLCGDRRDHDASSWS